MKFQPRARQRWDDLTRLFGEQGAVNASTITGILAFQDGEPVGWCSVAPRETYPSLERSRTLARIDAEPVWSIVCFVIAKPHRGRGVATRLIKAAVEYARAQGAKIVEAYPVEPGNRKLDAVMAFMGVESMFRRAGFEEVARPSPKRRIMRYFVR